MRTTVNLDDQLLDRLKQRASESGTSVSRLIEQAVRLALRRGPASSAAAPFELVTFGAGGRFSPYDIDKTSALLAAEDEARYGQR